MCFSWYITEWTDALEGAPELRSGWDEYFCKREIFGVSRDTNVSRRAKLTFDLSTKYVPCLVTIWPSNTPPRMEPKQWPEGSSGKNEMGWN